MANSSLNVASLDFDTLKDGFKEYLRSQTAFKDYNFEGSNMNVLLDVMSYNTYLNSFYLNMVASEMFLDSAQKLDSVMSHAKELNYLPKSYRSSSATISFSAETSGVYGLLTIPKGTLFSGQNSNGTFTFSTKEAYTYTSASTTFNIDQLSIYEGTYVTDSFVFDSTNGYQRFVLTNPSVDTDSLSVTVSENNGQDITTYEKKQTLYELTSSSAVYFIEPAQNGQYEVVFGDGILGRLPQNGAVVICEYRITTGSEGNGITSFRSTQDLGPVNGGQVTIGTITVDVNSSNGAEPEGIESIRKLAPRYFATQERAVSSDDYASLIYNKFGNLVSDVNVYGGETQVPKLYGRVIIAVKPAGGLIAPNYLKSEIQNYLVERTGLPVRSIIADPDYLYCGITSTIQYNKNNTTKTANDIRVNAVTAIRQFSVDHLEKFGNDFRYSKMVAHIDNTDTSITSNDTRINIIKRITPRLSYATRFEIDFNNPSEIEMSSPGYNVSIQQPFYDEPVLTSSSFTYVSDEGVEYPFSYFRDDNFGTIVIYVVVNGVFTIIKTNAGTINYSTGKVSINAFKTSYYDTNISIYMVPRNKDIIAAQNKIIVIDPNDISINVIETLK